MAFQVQDNKNISTNQFETINSQIIHVSFILGSFKSKLESKPVKGKDNGVLTFLKIIYTNKIKIVARPSKL